MAALAWLIPQADEREHLGGFYLAAFVSEMLNIVQPFQFVFLLLVMDRPSWALLPLMVEGIAVFFLEIPTGLVADRWGRKLSVILGDVISGLAWLLVPVALFLEGLPQLLLLCGAFAIEGLGQTLVSGAEESWVVDNLIALKRRDLTESYFAREKSLSSCGGLISALITWGLLSTVPISAGVIAGLWVLAALGQIASGLVLLPVPEREISAVDRIRFSDASTWIGSATGFKSCLQGFVRNRGLAAFTVVTLIISFATALTGDAFELSMITRGLNPKDLAPLTVIADVLGLLAPLFVVALAKRYKIPRLLASFLLVTAAASLWFFAAPSLGTVVALFLFFNVIDDLWDPLHDVMLHSFLSSSHRATMSSMINQGSEIMGIASLGVFSLMLGEHGEDLRDAIPSVVEAFQGEVVELAQVPLSLFNLPVGDAALVLMSGVSLLALFILVGFPWERGLHEISAEELLPVGAAKKAGAKQPAAPVAAIAAPDRAQLLATREHLDRALDRYNPGEQLSWWVAGDAFSLPPATIKQLQHLGPALTEFFRAAHHIMQTNPWVARQLAKSFTPQYRLLNAQTLPCFPRLIRPDVVCDEQWTVKLVELEITVGARADTAIMAQHYGLAPQQSLVRAYAQMVRELHGRGQTLALLTAPHPFFEDLPDDARAFAALIYEHTELDTVVVLTKENLSSLRFDGAHLYLNERFAAPRRIDVIDRFVDIYEIAECQHAGIAAILDALLAGAIYDVNTCCQSLDEKQWLSLFWHPALQAQWGELLSPAHLTLLQRHLPQTWFISPDLYLPLKNGATVSITELGDIKPSLRRFVIKESGTSTTASGAQGFHVLHEMSGEEIHELVQEILASKVEHIIQELVESPRISFVAIDPETDEIKRQEKARFKLSPFYMDGSLSDIRLVASDRQYAVNEKDCVVGVVRY